MNCLSLSLRSTKMDSSIKKKFHIRLPQLFLLMYSKSGFGIEMGLRDIRRVE